MSSGSAFELQSKIFKRIGLDAPAPSHGRKPRRAKPVSRKIERKAQRVQKKKAYRKPKTPLLHDCRSPRRPGAPSEAGPAVEDDEGHESVNDLESLDSVNLLEKRKNRSNDEKLRVVEDDGNEDLSVDGPDTDQDEPEQKTRISRATRQRLAQDDAEIQDLERKLGIKKGRKALPRAFRDDGLDELLGDASETEDEPKKRKHEYEDWLASKRSKGPGATALSDDDSFADFDGSSEGDDPDEDEATEACAQPPKRENPYVAPISGGTVAKYIPPSRRTTSTSTDETKDRLRKLIQGQINRLTDSNMLSIVQAIEDIYQRNARGDVTELLTDSIMAQVNKAESLPDQFFVLTGGFCAAVYKVIGSSFGSHLIRRVIIDLNDAYDKVMQEMGKQPVQSKEANNLVTFLTQLYVFQVVGCKIIFDYMERLLSALSELNIELLLRVCRMAGRMLRRDDPLSLKHVSEMVNKSVSSHGQPSLSVRTKFMIEVINDLKNSKPKSKGLDSAVVSDHVLRMRKRLGDLKSQPRRLDGLTPMGMGLVDVEKAGAHGQWWLVVAIFTALMTANDGEQGYRQFVNLRLKKDEHLEIARVLVQCVGSEAEYNAYYGQVGSLACANGKVRFAFQDRLWKLFRSLGEALFGEEADEEETAESERMRDERRASHVARFYASLVADGALAITVLKPLNLPELGRAASSFVERFVVCLLQACKGKESKESANVERVFGSARGAPGLAAGILWFLKSRLDRTGRVDVGGKRYDVPGDSRGLSDSPRAIVQNQKVEADVHILCISMDNNVVNANGPPVPRRSPTSSAACQDAHRPLTAPDGLPPVSGENLVDLYTRRRLLQVVATMESRLCYSLWSVRSPRPGRAPLTYMAAEEKDLVIIGGGVAGYVAAIKAGQEGMKVTCIEKRGTLGGTCLNVGCIPSKSLLNNSHLYHQILHDTAHRGIEVGDVKLNLAKFMKAKDTAVTGLTKGVEYLLKKNGVEYIKGEGSFANENEVKVDLSQGGETTVRGKNILIATGSESTPFPGLEIDEKRVITSTGALELKEIPKSMVVIGGGIIGLEMASVWSRLGTKVTVVEFLGQIGGPGMDAEIATNTLKLLKKQGMEFKLKTKVTSGDTTGEKVNLQVEAADGGKSESLEADVVLVAIGRRPYTKGLGLENIGMELDERGRVIIDSEYRTKIPHIRCIGDVTFGPMLAHKAEEEAVAVVEYIKKGHGHVNYGCIPSVMYTYPEVAWVGQSEQDLKNQKIPYRVGTFPFSANSRAKTNLDTDGLVKMLADPETDRLLGVHIIGPNAGEMIAEGTLALEYGASSEDIARTCHAHPTLAEAFKEAAMATSSKAIHF
ncbi:hypothetical protein CDD80_4872 [Ophiocordyceps camponoti-rufipedis]|uniref:Dihydrolipoyl dehydrogenase n=1 Tax=Ophiocordyceps camponoti-rufipedis TaxID=2004952 RepID=A0A2C5XUR0_9HYPO|nr:hypothetical protein CDD80_4872 [Ophiocordyceps camponoti-rufipedis]